MIELKNNRKTLYQLLNVISNFITEVNLDFDKNEFRIKAVHPSNHCMINLNIKKEFFEKYEIDMQHIYTLEINNLLKILKNASNNLIEIKPERDILVFKNIKNLYALNYFVGVKDERTKPSFEYRSKINLKSIDFFNLIDSCVEFDQIGCFEIKQNNFYINSKSHLVKSENLVDIINITGVDDKIYYDLSYIQLIKDIKNIFTNIDISMDSDYPLSIVGFNEHINFEFILANRIGDEE